MGVRNECDRLTCILNGKYDFELHFHQTNEESFYCLKRRQLGEYWCCLIKDCQTFWPDKCDKCNICKDFVVVLEYLQDAYFFLPNKNNHQPVLWRVFFKVGNKFRKFRIEIAKTVESKSIVLNYGLTC